MIPMLGRMQEADINKARYDLHNVLLCSLLSMTYASIADSNNFVDME